MNDRTLGVGLGVRDEFAHALVPHRARIDFVEVIGEQFVAPDRDARRRLATIADHFPVVVHTIGMSLGSVDAPDGGYLDAIGRLARDVDAPWVGDHLCYTRAGGIDVGHLAPLPRTEEALGAIVRNVEIARERTGRPLLLENIAYVVDPGGEIGEAGFLTRALEATGCDLLLDLTNLHANGANHGYDPYAWLERVPLERVRQVHVTGGHWHGGILVDSHSHETPSEVWRLLEHVAARVEVPAVLLERDERIPPIEALLDELDAAREALRVGAAKREEAASVA
jgi:uncharacterized protein (UPF0276 family)